MPSERVLVAMSGGVDSSVAAARLVAAGLDVVGVTLHLWDYPDDGSVKGRCCAPEDVHDARRVADFLGIPHYTFDRKQRFAEEVVDPFVDAYLAGITPSPCVRCNRGVKLRELGALRRQLGAAKVATGHYARLERTSRGPELLRGADPAKDQSYFLHMLGPEVLAWLDFPLGSATKAEVRQEALQLGLPGASKGESQELCFVPSGRYDAFVDERAQGRIRPGPLLDDRGRVVGEHDGVHRFTAGQRKNLGVALGYRAYVLEVDGASGSVTLGRRESARMRELQLASVSLRHPEPRPFRCDIVPRYRARPAPGWVEPSADGHARVRFDEPLELVAPGQYAVFYHGDRVLGGGVIARTGPDATCALPEVEVRP